MSRSSARSKSSQPSRPGGSGPADARHAVSRPADTRNTDSGRLSAPHSDTRNTDSGRSDSSRSHTRNSDSGRSDSPRTHTLHTGSGRSDALFPWVITFVVVAFIGFADAVYLTASHYSGALPTCTIVAGCDEVALSEYSTIGPLPIALLGALFYALMLVTGFLWLDVRKPELFRYMPLVTIPAFLFSVRLVWLMLFVINAICIYCLVSAVTTTLIMLLSLRLRLAN